MRPERAALSRDRGRGSGLVGALVGLATFVAGLGSEAAGEVPAREADPDELVPVLQKFGKATLDPDGIAIEVDQRGVFVLPFQAAARLAFDIEADSPFLLTWFVGTGPANVRIVGPPWRYVALRGREMQALDLDLTQQTQWGPSAVPGFMLSGTGIVHLRHLRWWAFAGSPEDAERARDGSVRFAPDAVGHTTINTLEPAMWSVSGETFTAEIVALAGAGGFVVTLLAMYGWRRWREKAGASAARARLAGMARLAAAASIAASVGAYDLYFLHRMLPALQVKLVADPERRIREDYAFAPEVGALASLARQRLGPNEKVGVQAAAQDWFSPQTICFNLAPRPCVILDPDRAGGWGISKVGRLAIGELDAVIVYDAPDALPVGFARLAEMNRNAYVARRAP